MKGSLDLQDINIDGEISLGFSGMDVPVLDDVLTYDGTNWRPEPSGSGGVSSETLYGTAMTSINIDPDIKTSFLDGEMYVSELNWIAASYPNTSSSLNYPLGLSVTPSGDVYTTTRLDTATTSRPVYSAGGVFASSPTTSRGLAVDKYDTNGTALFSVSLTNVGSYDYSGQSDPEKGVFVEHNPFSGQTHIFGIVTKGFNPATFYNASGVATVIPYTTPTVGGVGRSELPIVTFDAAGNFAWKARLLCAQSTALYNDEFYYQGTNIAVYNSTGDFYTLLRMGFNTQTVRAEDSDGVERVTFTPVANQYHYIITKWNSAGFAQWMTSIQDIGFNHTGHGMAVDQSSGDIIVRASTAQGGGTTFYSVGNIVGAGPLATSDNSYIAKWNPAGVFQFYAVTNFYVTPESVSVNPLNGDIFAVGTSSNSNVVNFYDVNSDSGSIAYTVAAPETFTYLISKWSSSGVPQWSTSVGETGAVSVIPQCTFDAKTGELYTTLNVTNATSRYYDTTTALQKTMTTGANGVVCPITLRINSTNGDLISYISTYSKIYAANSRSPGWTIIDPVRNVLYVQYFANAPSASAIYGQNDDGNESPVSLVPASTLNKTALYQFTMRPTFNFTLNLTNGTIDGFNKNLISITGNAYNIVGNVTDSGNDYTTITTNGSGLRGDTMNMVWNDAEQIWYSTGVNGFQFS